MIQIALTRHLQGAAGMMELDVQFTVAKGEVATLYGPSGAGKTSILRMIAGVLAPRAGDIVVNQNVWFDSKARIDLPPQKRSVGIVFQDYALFPNMSVRENIRYGIDGGRSDVVVDELIELMELQALHNKRPQWLSGGQQQRVAIARAIARRPSVLLLDEPFAALDTELRMRMQDYILSVHRTYGLTTIMVTHDILEVIRLSDKVFVMDKGRIVKAGSPADVIPRERIRDMIATLSRYYSPASDR